MLSTDPVPFPTSTREVFEAFWGELSAATSTVPASSPATRPPRGRALPNVTGRDPIARHLIEQGFVKSSDHSTGALNIECPFAAEHTQDSSESATRYFPANTGGYDRGNFKCMHAHCEGRSRADFLAAIGFEDITSRTNGLSRFFTYNPDVLRPQEYVIDGFLPIGLTSIAGGPGVGKTSLLVPLAAAAAHLYRSSIAAELRRKVVYVSEAPEQVERILYGLLQHADDPRPAAEFTDWFRIAPAQRLPPPEIGELIRAWVSAFTVEQEGYAVAPLIVLDTSNATIDLENENDNAEVGRAISAIKESMGNAAIWMISHTPKALKPDSSPADLTARGASAFAGDSNATAFIFEDPLSPGVRFLATRKVRTEPSLRELRFSSHIERKRVPTPWGTVQDVVYRFGIPEPSSPDARETTSAFARSAREEAQIAELEARIRAFVGMNAPVTKQSITDAVGGKAQRTRTCVAAMIKRGELAEGMGARGHPRYRLRPGIENENTAAKAKGDIDEPLA
jgi:hypothetical protein